MSKDIQDNPFLVFRLEDRRFGLPLARVERVIRAVDCTPLPNAPQAVLGVIDLQGTIVPVLNVRDKFGFADREIGLEDQFIVANTPRRTVALRVDRTTEVIERCTEEIIPTDKMVDQSDLIAGVIRLPDGLVLIHDLDQFLSAREESAMENAIAMQPGN